MVEALMKDLDDAITLKELVDPIQNYGLSKFELGKEMLADENLQKMGIENA